MQQVNYVPPPALAFLKYINDRFKYGYKFIIANQPAELGPLPEYHEQRGLKRPAAAQHRQPQRQRQAKGGTASTANAEGGDSDFGGDGGYDSDGEHGEERVCNGTADCTYELARSMKQGKVNSG
jgi:hypothetical protein